MALSQGGQIGTGNYSKHWLFQGAPVNYLQLAKEMDFIYHPADTIFTSSELMRSYSSERGEDLETGLKAGRANSRVKRELC